MQPLKNPDTGLVSIIVVHYGAQDLLRRCLNSIIRYTLNVEIIVVDNDQLAWDFSGLFPNVKLIRSAGNVGFGAACNAGAKVARGSILVFMNNDVEVDAEWLNCLIRPLSLGPVGCACPFVLHGHGREVVNATGGECDLIAFAWNRTMNRGDAFFYAPGCCIAVPRSVFDQIGGFDESLFLFLEDVDLSWRIRMAGWDIVHAADSIVYHEWMGSTSELSPSDIQYLFNRNRLRVIMKNYGEMKLIRILPIYFVLQFGLIMWVVARGQALELRAVLAGLRWNLRNLPDTIVAHQRAQFLRRTSDNDVMKFMYRGIAGIQLALGTRKHPVFETYFNRNATENT